MPDGKCQKHYGQQDKVSSEARHEGSFQDASIVQHFFSLQKKTIMIDVALISLIYENRKTRDRAEGCCDMLRAPAGLLYGGE